VRGAVRLFSDTFHAQVCGFFILHVNPITAHPGHYRKGRTGHTKVSCALFTYPFFVVGATRHTVTAAMREAVARCHRSQMLAPLGPRRSIRPSAAPRHRPASSRPRRRRSASWRRRRSIGPPEHRQWMVSARSAGALGGSARAFEAHLHRMKSLEALELVLVQG
jgi:hypothetical protein